MTSKVGVAHKISCPASVAAYFCKSGINNYTDVFCKGFKVFLQVWKLIIIHHMMSFASVFASLEINNYTDVFCKRFTVLPSNSI